VTGSLAADAVQRAGCCDQWSEALLREIARPTRFKRVVSTFGEWRSIQVSNGRISHCPVRPTSGGLRIRTPSRHQKSCAAFRGYGLAFLTLEEVTRLGVALDELEAEGVNPKALNIARLWALTGCRRDETAGLTWEEVKSEDGTLQLSNGEAGSPFARSAQPPSRFYGALISKTVAISSFRRNVAIGTSKARRTSGRKPSREPAFRE
jgi:integrase